MHSLEGSGKTVIKNQGIFAFTTEKRKPGQADQYATNPVEVSEAPDAETAVPLHEHSDEEIARALDGGGFSQLKALDFSAFKYPAENRDIYFKATVARKR